MPLGFGREIIGSSEKDEDLEIIVLHQGNTVESLLLQSYYKNQTSNWDSPLTQDEIDEAYETEDTYRKMGVVFGINDGAGQPKDGLTFGEIPSVFHMAFGTDAHGYEDLGISGYFGGLTGKIEQACGGVSGGFAGDTTINNSVNPHRIDWISVNFEPENYFSTLRCGFTGNPSTDDRAIDIGDPSRTNEGTTGFYDPITGTYQKFTNYPLFSLSDNSKGPRDASIQALKTYDKWIDDGAPGGNFTINGVGISSGRVDAYYEVGANTEMINPNTNVNVVLGHIPTYYNMWKAMSYAYEYVLRETPKYVSDVLGFKKRPKVMIWGKKTNNGQPLASGGWWNNPPQFGTNYTMQFGTNSVKKVASSSRSWGSGLTGYINYEWKATATPPALTRQTSSTTWSTSGGSYPLGNTYNRALASAFEGAQNFSETFKNSEYDAIANQYYAIIPDEDIRDICGTANWDSLNFTGNSSTYAPLGAGNIKLFMGSCDFSQVESPGLTLVPAATMNGLFLPKEDAIVALYKSLRLNWLSYYKYFGKKACIAMELHMDQFLSGNTHIGLATNNQDLEATYLKAMYDPITQEESELFGFDQGKVIAPKYFVFWCAAYFYLSRAFGSATSQELNDNKKEITNGYLRANLERRYPPEAGMTQDNAGHWRLGTSWHKYLCKKLDKFGIERIKKIISFADYQRFQVVQGEVSGGGGGPGQEGP